MEYVLLYTTGTDPQPYDPAALPLETVVERRAVRAPPPRLCENRPPAFPRVTPFPMEGRPKAFRPSLKP